MTRLATLLDRPGRPGWILFDPRDGVPRVWVPLRWMARLFTSPRLSRRLDYARPGEEWAR